MNKIKTHIHFIIVILLNKYHWLISILIKIRWENLKKKQQVEVFFLNIYSRWFSEKKISCLFPDLICLNNK